MISTSYANESKSYKEAYQLSLFEVNSVKFDQSKTQTCGKIFVLEKDNDKSGKTEWSGGLWFETKNPNDVDKIINGKNMKNVAAAWFTNIEHGRRHQPLRLMTMFDNMKYSKHKEILNKEYKKYDNYDANNFSLLIKREYRF